MFSPPFAAAKAVKFEMSPFVNPQTEAFQNGRWFLEIS
jgi:hypothetical protein